MCVSYVKKKQNMTSATFSNMSLLQQADWVAKMTKFATGEYKFALNKTERNWLIWTTHQSRYYEDKGVIDEDFWGFCFTTTQSFSNFLVNNSPRKNKKKKKTNDQLDLTTAVQQFMQSPFSPYTGMQSPYQQIFPQQGAQVQFPQMYPYQRPRYY